MEIGLLTFPTDKGIQPVELGASPNRVAAIATMNKYAPLVAEFNN